MSKYYYREKQKRALLFTFIAVVYGFFLFLNPNYLVFLAILFSIIITLFAQNACFSTSTLTFWGEMCGRLQYMPGSTAEEKKKCCATRYMKDINHALSIEFWRQHPFLCRNGITYKTHSYFVVKILKTCGVSFNKDVIYTNLIEMRRNDKMSFAGHFFKVQITRKKDKNSLLFLETLGEHATEEDYKEAMKKRPYYKVIVKLNI